LGLLKEVVPGLSKVALLVNVNSPLASGYETAVNDAAGGLGLVGTAFKWKSPDDLKPTFAAMKAAGVQAVMFNPDGWAFTYRDLISKLAVENRLSTSAYSRQTLSAGALMSYGVDHDAILYRVAIYVSKILKGVKVEELPIEQPTKFEFLINLKTARTLRLTIPPSIYVAARRRGDRVVHRLRRSSRRFENDADLVVGPPLRTTAAGDAINHHVETRGHSEGGGHPQCSARL